MTIATAVHIVYYVLMLFVTHHSTLDSIGYQHAGS